MIAAARLADSDVGSRADQKQSRRGIKGGLAIGQASISILEFGEFTLS